MRLPGAALTQRVRSMKDCVRLCLFVTSAWLTVSCGQSSSSSNGGSANAGAAATGESQAGSGTNATGGDANTQGGNGSGGADANPSGGDGTTVTGGSAGASSGGEAGGAGSGGATSTNPGLAGPRTVLTFDDAWRFVTGDPAGAAQTAFADTAWRALSVPHDWSIEGPFSETATTTGRGGYLPAGVGWYRKHFTVAQTLSTSQVFVEFDGVMANSDVYINGTLLGHRPYGYVGFRYDITAQVKFGTTDNVIAVRCDNSVQPASRWYTGAGINRHVRLIATNPVHIDQWATFVTTPTATATSATVHVQTSVVNNGTTSQSVSLQGMVSDPSGTALAPVSAAAQTIAAGASASYSFDVPVTNPKLWDLATPNMYQLVSNVQVGGTTVDDDVTPFGIRSLTFDGTTGMNLNGKNVKFKGIAMHQEVSGLGSAVPMRALQRRLAQLKALGVNAIRTSHAPVAPELLDLCDRMGFLVLDEFFDVWTAHKYTDVGDYAAYFNKAATGSFGSPSAGAGATWWQTDVTDILMRDRNHPSVALYSMGNEIHDSIATRTPIATKMIALCHQLDPSRKVTQALLDPGTAGDVTGATRTLVDVWGDNYDVASCLTAIATTPTRAGLLTEMGHETSTWATVMKTPALTGEFLWTGVDYLGEAPDGWPTVGSGAGLMDRLGTTKADGYTYQKLWGATVTTPPATGTTAAKVALTADHATLLTDPNDVTYVKATISDASGKLVSSSSAPVTFAISGPGTIIAVDSGSQTQESFRGTQRNAYQGVCFAIIQATGAGAIMVTASSNGLTGSSVMVQGTAGTFTPCSGSCD
jgi:beta-galactosidase